MSLDSPTDKRNKQRHVLLSIDSLARVSISQIVYILSLKFPSVDVYAMQFSAVARTAVTGRRTLGSFGPFIFRLLWS
jgi:hypothetical protein